MTRKFDLTVMAVCLGLLGYFGWHGFHGPRSFEHRDILAGRATAFSERLAAVREQREVLERRVSLMRPQSIDPDMLDELARTMLDFGKPTDLVVRLPD